MTSSHDLEAAIAVLEKQRGILGDNVVDIAVKPLQAHLDALRSKGWSTDDTQRLKQVMLRPSGRFQSNNPIPTLELANGDLRSTPCTSVISQIFLNTRNWLNP